MKVTVKAQEADGWADENTRYDVSGDGRKIGTMTVNYPHQPTVYFGNPTVIGSMTFSNLPNEALIGLLSAHESTLPDKNQLAVLYMAKAAHRLQSESHSITSMTTKTVKKYDGTVAAYREAGKVIDDVRGKLTHGEVDFDEAITLLQLAARKITGKNEAIAAEVGEHAMGYLEQELGMAPKNVARALTDAAQALDYAHKIFQGKHEELLSGLGK